jgi:phage/plasmid-like protein (TIGR03299 family)
MANKLKKRIGKILVHANLGGIYGGTYVEDNPNVLSAMQACGLDWETKIAPVGLRDKVRTQFPRHYGTYRSIGPSQNIPFDIVKSRYRPMQNREAFAWVDKVLGGKLDATIVAGGMIKDGVKVWIAVDLGQFEVVPGDVVRKIMVIMNSNDGTSNWSVHMIPLREGSQVMMNFHDVGGFYTVRHTRGAPEKLSQIEGIMKIGLDLLKDFEAKAKKMAKVKLSDDETREVLLRSLGVTMREYDEFMAKVQSGDPIGKQPQWVNQYNTLREMLEHGPGNSYAKGTLWAALGAIQGFQDLIRTVRGSGKDEGNFYESKMIGYSAKHKANGFNLCASLLPQTAPTGRAK